MTDKLKEITDQLDNKFEVEIDQIEHVDEKPAKEILAEIQGKEIDMIKSDLYDKGRQYEDLREKVVNMEDELIQRIQEVVRKMKLADVNMEQEEPELFYAAVRELVIHRELLYFVYNVKIGAMDLDSYENIKALSESTSRILDHANKFYATINAMLAELDAKHTRNDNELINLQNKELELMAREDAIEELEAIKEQIPTWYKVGAVVAGLIITVVSYLFGNAS